MILLFKLTLAPASILLATLVARRFGHGASGFLSGFPVISGPIVAVLMFSLPAGQVEDIARATIAASPATFAHIVAFAWLSRRLPWWGCLIGAAAAFLAVGVSTTASWVPGALQWALAIAGPFAALAAMPRASAVTGAVPVPRIEVAMRVVGTFVLAATVILGAQHVPAVVSGLLLAWPISGTILPCFTLPAYGHPATVTLLRGLSVGLAGFVWFYIALALLLGAGVGGVVAFVAAALTAGAVGWLFKR
ncbi:MAG: hypothetical protein LT102_07540 [Burkholderiaceae bacterium]|nr:hypothetical protein [Burkholderiaceae bacterium]